MGSVPDAETTHQPLGLQVARLAAAQHGVFTRKQVARLGATKDVIRRRIQTGGWDPVAPDVFRLAGTAASWPQSLMVACLAWGEGSVISHRAAAALWRLSGFPPGPIELTVPRDRRRSAPGIVHRRALTPVDTTTIDRIPVTTAARTLIDVASVADEDAVEEALDDALRRRVVSIVRLRWRVHELPRRRGVVLMRRLLEARTSGSAPQSVLETRLLRAMRCAGLPEPVVQHEVRDRGRVIAVVDFAYPRQRLAIEADGYQWHSGRRQWQRDRLRRNELTLLGWRMIHVTWTDLAGRRDEAIDSIRQALADRPASRGNRDAP